MELGIIIWALLVVFVAACLLPWWFTAGVIGASVLSIIFDNFNL